jgi:hypothetical protein
MSLERSASKRPRWTVNAEACLFCRKRKSRCRVTSASGACERCREAGQRCSLQTEDDRNDHHQDTATFGEGGSREMDLLGQLVESRRLLVRLDSRTKDLMEMLGGQGLARYVGDRRPSVTQDRLGREFSGIREDGVGDDDDIEDGIQDLLTRRLGTSLLYVTGINLHDRTSFVDPVGAGLIPDTGMKSVMER